MFDHPPMPLILVIFFFSILFDEKDFLGQNSSWYRRHLYQSAQYPTEQPPPPYLYYHLQTYQDCIRTMLAVENLLFFFIWHFRLLFVALLHQKYFETWNMTPSILYRSASIQKNNLLCSVLLISIVKLQGGRQAEQFKTAMITSHQKQC